MVFYHSSIKVTDTVSQVPSPGPVFLHQTPLPSSEPMFVYLTQRSFIRPCVPSEPMFVHQTLGSFIRLHVSSPDPWALAPVLHAPITLLHCNFCNLCHSPDKSGYLHLLCTVWLAVLLLAVGKPPAPSPQHLVWSDRWQASWSNNRCEIQSSCLSCDLICHYQCSTPGLQPSLCSALTSSYHTGSPCSEDPSLINPLIKFSCVCALGQYFK